MCKVGKKYNMFVTVDLKTTHNINFKKALNEKRYLCC